MHQVNVTKFRSQLPKYLASVENGEEILITSHGKVIAKLIPPVDTQDKAKQQLRKLRKNSKVFDVISPIDENWDAEK